MQEHTDDRTTQTTGRGYNRHATDPERAATGVATDLYAPVPGDDNDTRPGMVGSGTPTTTRHEYRDTDRPSMDVARSDRQQWDQTTPRTSPAYTMQSRSRQSDGGIMQKIQDNPLAVVAAATAGGVLVGRMMRKRSHRNDEGYLRASFGNEYGYQGYRSPQPYQRPAFYPYQTNPGSQAYRGVPQYRADQEFRPEQGFQGRHENFPGDSNWD